MVCSFLFAACGIALSTASPSPECRQPFADAGIINAMAPDYPDSARYFKLGPVTVLAEVTVGPDGKPQDVSIYKSSGNGAIDREALRAAQASTYSPKVINCKPVIGQFLFRAEFNPGPNPADSMHLRSFVPPAQWARNVNATPASGFRELGEWTHANSVIGVMATFSSETLAQYVARRTQELKASLADISSSEFIALCNGENGWKLAYSEGGTYYMEALQLLDDRLYDAYYYSTDGAPDERIIRSMQSLCGS
jgi:TonB family protein